MTDKAPHPDQAQPYDSSDPEQVAKATLEAARREKERLDVVAAIMASPSGRAWIWSELVAARIFATTFVSGDPMASAFAEGERNGGLRLFSQVMKAAPDNYIIMAREAAQ